VDARTRYLERGPSGALRGIGRSAVAVGDTVEVYVEGPVAESCPAQAYAGTVIRAAGS
jgi:ribosomal protein L19